MEEYRTIEEYENYEISNLGNVRNKKTGNILTQILRYDGYYCVNVRKNSKPKNLSIHRLIALSFIPNPSNKPFVDHVNRSRSDNRLENLRWCTRSENQMNKSKHSNNTSTYTGVSYNKSNNKWKVRIAINGKKKHIGYYTNFDEAVIARKEQEKIHYKEFQAFQSEMEQLEYEFEQLIK